MQIIYNSVCRVSKQIVMHIAIGNANNIVFYLYYITKGYEIKLSTKSPITIIKIQAWVAGSNILFLRSYESC